MHCTFTGTYTFPDRCDALEFRGCLGIRQRHLPRAIAPNILPNHERPAPAHRKYASPGELTKRVTNQPYRQEFLKNPAAEASNRQKGFLQRSWTNLLPPTDLTWTSHLESATDLNLFPLKYSVIISALRLSLPKTPCHKSKFSPLKTTYHRLGVTQVRRLSEPCRN